VSDFTVYNNIPRIIPGGTPTAAGKTVNEDGSSFGGLLKDAITEVEGLEVRSQAELQKFLGGESDLHSVMVALEKADLSFQMMMQVRNKFVQAYQEIMKSQV
jgi:flagellar hook-basal body complex protein FliE